MPTATIAQARRWLLAAMLLAALLSPAPAAGGEVEKVADLSAFIRNYLGADAKKEKFQFAVISDAHVGSDAGAEKNFRALLSDIRAAGGMDFVVSTGDLTESKAEHARKYMEIFREILARTRHVAVMGNHDGKGTAVMQGVYGIDCAGEAVNCNYSFDYGKLHFTIVHNGQRELLDPINRKFLAADLAAARDRPTLLFYHIHVMCPSPGQAHLSYMGEKRYRALEFLNGFPQIQGCFAGHDHAFWHGRYMDKNFFSTVGSWYQCGGTRNGWWWLKVDGEKITVLRKQIGKPAEAMPAWEEFPPYPTAMQNAEKRNGRLEIPLFAEKLTGAGYYWGTQGYLTGRQEGVAPVAGEKMICCMELGRVRQGVLGCQDYKVNPGDRLAYWMFVPPGAQQWDVGVRVADRRFERLRDQNGLPAFVNLGKAGVSPGNWLYREIPLGGIDRWFSTFTARTPGRYASWPTRGLHSSWRLFLDDVCLLRQADGAAAAAAPPGKVEKLKAETVGAGYVVLAWENAAGARHYRVQRAEGGEKRFIGTSPVGRFFDFTVRADREYEYAVTAVNAALAAGPAGTVAVETARSDPPPAKVTGLKGALLPKGRFVFAGTWHAKPAVHISWDGKHDLNDLRVKSYRLYRVLDGEKKLFAETIGRYALADEGKLGDTFAVAAVNHAGQEGPPAEIQITQTWKGPGEAFHLRTGNEDAGK